MEEICAVACHPCPKKTGHKHTQSSVKRTVAIRRKSAIHIRCSFLISGKYQHFFSAQ